MIIQHREVKKYINADAPSRIKEDRCPFYKKDFKIEDLACGGYYYCRRAHKNGGKFFDGVDDVVPLNAINKSNKDKETQCGENICVRLVDKPSWLQSYSWEEIKTAQEMTKN